MSKKDKTIEKDDITYIPDDLENDMIDLKIEDDVPEIEEEKLDSIDKYVVEKGDNIYSIAKKLNIDYKKLYRDNKDVIGNDLNYIKVGMMLTINK